MRLPGARSRPTRPDRELRRLEERCRALSEAAEQWRTVLSDMERDGESSDSRYEGYYRAYLEAREREKEAQLELFNLRQGLAG